MERLSSRPLEGSDSGGNDFPADPVHPVTITTDKHQKLGRNPIWENHQNSRFHQETASWLSSRPLEGSDSGGDDSPANLTCLEHRRCYPAGCRSKNEELDRSEGRKGALGDRPNCENVRTRDSPTKTVRIKDSPTKTLRTRDSSPGEKSLRSSPFGRRGKTEIFPGKSRPLIGRNPNPPRIPDFSINRQVATEESQTISDLQSVYNSSAHSKLLPSNMEQHLSISLEDGELEFTLNLSKVAISPVPTSSAATTVNRVFVRTL